ncbi:membrane-bound lytic murein transglycosylase MltF [Seongchinamella sediminis]|uniref:Membrane-bound lytic murein transglycosylase F n=1 Tax=Seongchinamella sediminis TaxID=2283635 RepID=A0A3L7E4K0_9GAMM|nr:membrane-bound lytic murein transglycosylase MltF [Seongchinamella sediminis]RLQ23840.1 membrane-bound lytic murein transglycosylase MltF [Seongchinamella sediminis]
MKPLHRLLPLLLLSLLAACSREDSLERIEASGKLTVVSRNSPTTYYLDKGLPTGFEYTLAAMFAAELGVELEIVPAFGLEDIFVTLDRGEADIAAAGLALTGEREADYPHSTPYYQLRPLIVYRAGSFRPRDPGDLEDMSIVVLTGSAHSSALDALSNGGFPQLNWREVDHADSTELLAMVDNGEAQLAVIDSSEFEVQQSLYPRLKLAFELGSAQDMVWYLSPERDNEALLLRINQFLAGLQEQGTLDKLREEHFGHSRTVSRIGSHTFNLNVERILPGYQDLIEQVAAEYQMDWPLLAAMAYQESHWDPLAESPTGVRGMMMLTAPTAREVGVTDRLDPGQSLRGGARYYKQIKRRLPDDIYEPDRTYMALAAYNIGRGHLEDARLLTDRQGGDPHLWRDVMERLPLLQNSKYYQTLRHGYARGREAATYVQNIRHYRGILAWQDIARNKPLPPVATDPLLPAVLRRVGLNAL